MLKISIRQLRNIQNFDFEVPRRGVWLLTGTNGAGKTSLLACLRRLKFRNAFPVHFKASLLSTALDNFEGATIKYNFGNDEVTYTYKTERWAPTPKRNSRLLATAATYPEVVYIAADSKRLEPNNEDFQPRRIRPASSDIQNAANRIFGTTKFSHLATINLTSGKGNQAFLLDLQTTPKTYYSEKHFSLGELCILKLLRLLTTCSQGSLLLIDELELALHPSAQAELLEYLTEIADQKSLTVIVSTHSATLIKQAPKKSLLYLQNENGNVSCLKECFPSYVLGAMAYREEAAMDVIIYVEDEAARIVLEQFIARVTPDIFPGDQLLPSVAVIPVGGISNVLRFYNKQAPILPQVTRAYVVLDADAQPLLLNAQQADIRGILTRHASKISYLMYTAEVALAVLLDAELVVVRDYLRNHYSNNSILIRRTDFPQLPATPLADRKECKRVVDVACEKLAEQISGVLATDMKTTLLKYLAEQTFVRRRAEVMQLIAPILRG